MPAKKRPAPPRGTSAESIEKIDTQILELLLRRLKAQPHPSGHLQPDPPRIPTAMAAQFAAFGVDEAELATLLRHVASLSRRAEKRDRVAFLGPEFSYSHLAALHYFGEGEQPLPVASIATVFRSVERGDAGRGVVPLENSTDGRIVDTLSQLAERRVKICGEVYVPIHHCLLGTGQRESIREVYSKPQALSQCRRWLAENLAQAQIIETSSTAAAAQIARGNPAAAAIAGIEAGRAYGLHAIDENIEDNPNNITRFAILGNDTPAASGDDKTTLLIQLHHEPGALADAMAVFKRARLNLTWIESFPVPELPNEYLFFVELLGHLDDDVVRDAIAKLKRRVALLEVLGTYPRNPLAKSR